MHPVLLLRALSLRIAAAILLVVGFAGDASAQSDDLQPTVILISLDGFRWDYLDLYDAPVLDSLASNGILAERLTPVFPSKTFPNHYSIVTGLYAENHGVISNTMYDPEMDARFSMSNSEAVGDARWWGGEPIWVTAEKQGQTAATYFWPGSEAPIQDIRPTYWVAYDGSIPGESRVDHILEWLDLPQSERPTFLTLYFSDVDSDGHRHGPDSDQVAQAVTRVDAYIRRLVDGLDERGILDDVHLLIVADHGMARTSPERVIIIDDYFDPAGARIVDYSPVLMAYLPDDVRETAYRKLDDHRFVEAYWKEDLPARYHLDHPRTPPFIAVAAEGWEFTTRERYEENPDRFHGGSHGYDHLATTMGGLFIGHGPAFGKGQIVPPLEAVDLYNVMCEILGLDPVPNDGDPQIVTQLISREMAPSE